MLKLIRPQEQTHTAINSLCTHGYALLMYNTTREDYFNGYLYKCNTHFNKYMTLPECLECLCQSAELLEGALKHEVIP